MCRSRSDVGRTRAALALALALASGGCAVEPGEYQFGYNITGLRFELFHEDEGIYPSDVVLTNPRNPFRDFPPGVPNTTAFRILAEGGNAGAFYYWASSLATVPLGETQYYTATKLHDIAVSGELADAVEVCRVTLMAGRAYQTVLDEFPDAVSFLEDGTPFYLAPLAYRGIEDLGLEVLGDWQLAVTPDGTEIVTRIVGGDGPRMEYPPPPGEEALDPCLPR